MGAEGCKVMLKQQAFGSIAAVGCMVYMPGELQGLCATCAGCHVGDCGLALVAGGAVGGFVCWLCVGRWGAEARNGEPPSAPIVAFLYSQQPAGH